MDSVFKIISGLVKIRGGTNGTVIGNEADRLKVSGLFSVPAMSSKLRYVDMNVASGGVARETLITNATWVDIFSYSGSGLFCSFLANLETGDDWRVRLIVDGQEVFGSEGIDTHSIENDALYDLDPSGKNTMELAEGVGLYIGAHNRLIYSGPFGKPVSYNSSVVIKVIRDVGAASKKFKAGLAILTKET